jgi:hypothetical protein
MAAYVTAWRSVGKYIFFSPNASPIKLPKMKIKQKADKVFAAENKR